MEVCLLGTTDKPVMPQLGFFLCSSGSSLTDFARTDRALSVGDRPTFGDALPTLGGAASCFLCRTYGLFRLLGTTDIRLAINGVTADLPLQSARGSCGRQFLHRSRDQRALPERGRTTSSQPGTPAGNSARSWPPPPVSERCQTESSLVRQNRSPRRVSPQSDKGAFRSIALVATASRWPFPFDRVRSGPRGP